MRALSLLLTALFALVVSACGFQLRGAYTLPFNTLFVSLPEASELYAQIRRSVEAGSSARVVTDVKTAEANLVVIADIPQKNILSLDSAGRVREFQLVRIFTFRIINTQGVELVPQSQIVVRRDISFSDSQVLSKEAEEQLLLRDMQNDLVQQLLRRLAAVKLKAA